MGRNRIYDNQADRQRAYRERGSQTKKPTSPAARRPPSRPARLAALEKAATELKEEYESWLGSLPESLAGSAVAERLTEAAEQLDQVVELIAGIEPPRGFGRD